MAYNVKTISPLVMNSEILSVGKYELSDASGLFAKLQIDNDYLVIARPGKGKVYVPVPEGVSEILSSGEVSEDAMEALIAESTPACSCDGCYTDCQFRNISEEAVPVAE